MEFCVRPATVDDAERLAEIDLIPEVRPWLDLPPEASRGRDAWVRANREWVEHPEHHCVVAVLPNGFVAGSVTLRYTRNDLDGVCLALKVDPEYQGQGIGSALLRWVIETADAVPLARVYLAVLRSNSLAIALYARHGFVYAGPTAHDCDRMVRHRPRRHHR